MHGNPGANFSVQPRTHQRSGALDSHGRRDHPQLLLRGAFGGHQLSARGMADLFHFHEPETRKRSVSAAVSRRAAARISATSWSSRAIFVSTSRSSRSASAFAADASVMLAAMAFALARKKRPAVLRDQVPDPAKHKNEIEPSEISPAVDAP